MILKPLQNRVAIGLAKIPIKLNTWTIVEWESVFSLEGEGGAWPIGKDGLKIIKAGES